MLESYRNISDLILKIFTDETPKKILLIRFYSTVMIFKCYSR